jgi:hypothetical protein
MKQQVQKSTQPEKLGLGAGKEHLVANKNGARTDHRERSKFPGTYIITIKKIPGLSEQDILLP